MDLQETNQLLEAVGLPIIDMPALKMVTERGSVATFERALQQAKSQPNAKQYVINTLTELGIQSGLAHGEEPQADTSQRESARAAPQPHSDNGNVTNFSEPSSAKDTSSLSLEEKKQLGFHIYAGSAALDILPDVTQAGFHTIRIEAAPASAPGSRSYLWNDKKISVQITRSELPIVAATILGLVPYCEFDSHGEGKNKGFSIENQENNIFVSLFTKGQRLAVPISAADAFYAASLVLRQIRASQVWLEGGDIMTILRAIVGRLAAEHSKKLLRKAQSSRQQARSAAG